MADLRARLSASETKLAAITRVLKVGDKDTWDKPGGGESAPD